MTINYERIREEWKEFVSQKCSVLEIYKKGGYDKKIADYWLNILSQEVEKARKEEREKVLKEVREVGEILKNVESNYLTEEEAWHKGVQTGMEIVKNCEHEYEKNKHVCKKCAEHDGYSRSCGSEWCMCNN